MAKITLNAEGIPGAHAENVRDAYRALGYLHYTYRPLQLLLLHTSAQGRLAELLVPKKELVAQDALMHRLEIPQIGQKQASELGSDVRDLLLAYIDGIHTASKKAKTPRTLRPLFFRAPTITIETVLSALMFSAYMGLSQSQERMERIIIEALKQNADETFLHDFFSPHLEHWNPNLLRQLTNTKPGLGFAANPLFMQSGSNAWAIRGERSASGYPMLCGDPHLQINQIPALLFETRIRFGENFWLGATIPGLPGIAVGRNKNVSWSGTFSCADNVDFFIDDVVDGKSSGASQAEPLLKRDIRLKRRGLSPQHVNYFSNALGTYENIAPSGKSLSTNWAGKYNVHEAMEAYMRLPCAKDVHDAQKILEKAHTLSLHFILADRYGEICYTQAGTVPKRSPKWSGLYPADRASGQGWDGVITGENLPQDNTQKDFLVSANEARPGVHGETISTFSQPLYRYHRIEQLLKASQKHDRKSMEKIQCDIYSLQAEKLKPIILNYLKPSPLSKTLQAWDCRYESESPGAHAFELCYHEMIKALHPWLGGDWFKEKLKSSELRLWWCRNIDRYFLEKLPHNKGVQKSIAEHLDRLPKDQPSPYRDVAKLEFKHLVWGPLGRIFGQPSRNIHMSGSRGTIQQANSFMVNDQKVFVGPAYRMICDMSEDCIWTTIPGGVHEDENQSAYWPAIQQWQDGIYHRLVPPQDDEQVKESL